MFRVKYTDNGKIIGFYAGDIEYDEDFTKNCITITDEQRQQMYRAPEGKEWCVQNGQAVVRDIVYTPEERAAAEAAALNRLRKVRSYECFSVVNRGELWYRTLTDAQREELAAWYRQWLDVTATRVEPAKPVWLK